MNQVLVGLQGQDQRGDTNGQQAHQRELGGGQRIGEGRCDGDDGEDQGEDVLHQVQRGGPFNVVDNPAPLGHHRGHGGEVGVHQHQVRDLGSYVTAGGHGHAAVGLLQGQHVVDAVTGHGHGVFLALEGLDELFLLIGLHPAEDVIGLASGGDLGLRGQGGGIHVLVGPFNPGLPGGGSHGDGVVPGDHFDGHALVPEVGKGLLGVFPDGVAQQYEGQGMGVGNAPAVGPRAAGGQEKDPAAVGHGLLCHGPVGGIALRP